MTLTATATQGFEDLRPVGYGEVFWVPGDPGVTYVRGDKCFMDYSTAGAEGCLLQGTDSLAATIFTVVKSTVCPAATQPFPNPWTFDPSRAWDAAELLCLVPVTVDGLIGANIQKAMLTGYRDETVVSYTASTRAIECTTGMGADDRPNGALLYVYEGTTITRVAQLSF